MPEVRACSSKSRRPQVDEQRVRLVPVVGDEEVGAAVAVDVLGVDAHARADAAGGVVARARGVGGILEGAVAPVEEHEIRAEVIGDVEVGPAVAVEVGGDDAQPPAVAAADARRAGRRR